MDDVKQLKVTFWGHIRMIGFTLLVYAFFVFLTVYSCIYSFKPVLPFLLYMMVIPFGFIILPVFYIHYNYSKYNDEISYELKRNVSITKIDGDSKHVYNIDEFEQFKLIATKSKLVGTNGAGLFSNYHFVKLKLINGEELTFTCLYSSDIYTLLKSFFPSVPMKQEGVFYPNISEHDFE